jgi:hypothetical protein
MNNVQYLSRGFACQITGCGKYVTHEEFKPTYDSWLGVCDDHCATDCDWGAPFGLAVHNGS